MGPLKIPFMQRRALYLVSGLYLDHPLAIPIHPPLFHCPCLLLSIVSDTLGAMPQFLKLSSCSLTLTELDGLCFLEFWYFSSL